MVERNDKTIMLKDAAKLCADAGYGEDLPDNYSNGTPTVVAGYLMPRWMAELLGHIGRDNNTPEGSKPKR